eukprot:7872788-Pyramimonas_sp.AAC.1
MQARQPDAGHAVQIAGLKRRTLLNDEMWKRGTSMWFLDSPGPDICQTPSYFKQRGSAPRFEGGDAKLLSRLVFPLHVACRGRRVYGALPPASPSHHSPGTFC